MKMWFHPSLKDVEAAFNAKDTKPLQKKFNRFAEHILDALEIVKAADTLSDLQSFYYLYPHIMRKDRRHKYERFSISPAGKKNSLRITLVCSDEEDKTIVLEKIDLFSTAVIIEEVGIHYGD